MLFFERHGITKRIVHNDNFNLIHTEKKCVYGSTYCLPEMKSMHKYYLTNGVFSIVGTQTKKNMRRLCSALWRRQQKKIYERIIKYEM